MSSKNLDRAIVTIGKDKLAELPAENFTGEIIVVDNPEQVVSAVEDLLTADIIGFDTETRPSFRRGQIHNVALIQLCNQKRCYLFRINILGLPNELINLLENPNLLKVGLSLHDDFHQLKKLAEFNPSSFIDLQGFVKDYKIADNSLTRLYGILFDKRISKSQRLTNWETNILSEAQKHYAALDAFACIRIYNYLKKGNFDPSKSKYLTYLPDPEELEEFKKPEEEKV